MTKLRLRLLCAPVLRHQDGETAFHTLREMERFGVRVERADSRNPDAWAGVRGAGFLHDVFQCRWERQVELRQWITTPLNGQPRNDASPALGIGVTPICIREWEEGRVDYRRGMGLFGIGSLISIYGITRLPPDYMRQRAIEAAVRNSMGDLFIPPGEYDHPSDRCTDAGCALQEIRNFTDLLRRFAGPRLDYCRGCEEKIQAGVKRILEEGSRPPTEIIPG